MRYWSISLLLFFVFPATGLAGPLPVRPVDPNAAHMLARGLERSPLVRDLVRRLEASDVVVHLETARDLPSGIGGMTRWVTGGGGYRYLRISLRADLARPDRLAMLAHELRHACEVADSTARSADEFRRLFEQAGHQLGKYFETHAALEAERIARMELRGAPVPGHEAPSPARGTGHEAPTGNRR
jgi:hypothetical protein